MDHIDSEKTAHKERSRSQQEHRAAIRNSKRGKERFLGLSIEAKHTRVPFVTERLPGESGTVEHGRAPQSLEKTTMSRLRLRVGAAPLEKVIETKIHAIGRDDAGWIDACPTPFRQPDFTPGVRIRLAHEKEFSDIVVFAAKISGN